MSSHLAGVAHRPDQLGHFGSWGGRFVPEVLMAALDQLTEAFEDAIRDPSFNAELDALRRDYAGRPTPLFPARRLSEELGLRVSRCWPRELLSLWAPVCSRSSRLSQTRRPSSSDSRRAGNRGVGRPA